MTRIPSNDLGIYLFLLMFSFLIGFLGAGVKMPAFTRIRAVAWQFPSMAAAIQIIGMSHPPFCFAPVYTIFPLHFKIIFES
jgi:hypothetical protein